MTLRSPIVSVLGHVDHGKSSILDAIRGTNILSTEAGAITQAIGASIVPISAIKDKAGTLLATMRIELTIPGLLFIDTPGHAAFTSLRKRGGSLADIAIVVVDLNEGFKPQTIEAIEILRSAKTPFLIAANKMDLIHGYKRKHDRILQDIQGQEPAWITTFETRMYELVGRLHETFGMSAERFDRVESFTSQVAIVPTSAKTGQGIAELLMVLAGLAQKYLEQGLRLDVSGPGKGTVLELKETTGFGITADVILYDGTIRRNDTIVLATTEGPIITKVRALLEPAPMQEMRDKKAKYQQLPQATAATGLRIAAPGLEKAMAGMPLRVSSPADAAAVAAELQREVDTTSIPLDKDGVVLKADTIGSLEALAVLLREKGIPVRKASVGPIAKKDIAEAEADADPQHRVILGFNIPHEESSTVKVIISDVIYRIIEDLEVWRASLKKEQEAAELESLVRPCKIEILQNCIFRQNNPCVAGVEVRAGLLRAGVALMDKEGKQLTTAQTIQRQKESTQTAKWGEQVAVSMPGVTAGRQVHEQDILYSAIDEPSFRELKRLSRYLSPDEKEALKEIADIRRKSNPLWGV